MQSIAESIRQLTLGGAEAQQPAEETTESENEQTEPAAEEIAQEIIAEDAGSEDRSESVTEKKTTAESAKTTVQVVVRKPQPVVRVTPVKKRVITEPARSTNASRTSGSNSRPKLSRSSVSGHLRAVESDPIAFEQYIRDIALAAVSTAEKTAEEAAPVSHRRFGRISRAAEMPAETASQPVAVAVSQREEAQPVPQQNKPEAAAEVAAEETAAGEKTSRRKSRFPHNSEALTGLIAALRKERSVAREESEPAQTEAAEVREIVATVRAAALAQDNAESAQAAESGVKVIRLSDAISERKVSDLQEAVNKFMSLDSNPEAVPLTARVCLRRR